MLVAYLERPPEFVDETGVPQAKFIQGLVKSVSERQRLCYITTTGRTANYTGKPDAWKTVQRDQYSGRLWLGDMVKQFDEFQGGFFVPLPQTLVGQRVYMRTQCSRVRKADSSWLETWFLMDDYNKERQALTSELLQQQEQAAAPIYSVELIERSETQPVCDPVLKQFVSGCRESTTVIFKGNDLKVMQQLLDELWPSTWNREIVIRDLGQAGNDSKTCSCLPWSPSTPLRRVDKLLV